MKNILVIGGGAMGSAFTIPCLENKNKVTITEPYSKNFIKELSSKNKFHSSLQINLPTSLKFRKFSMDLMRENFDLIVSGLQSNDNGHAQVGLLVAELLNTSHASLVMGTEIINDSTIKVKQELENGWFQWSELDLPASLTIQSGINEPRYATLKGIMSVKNKPVEKLENKSDNLNNGYALKDLYIPKVFKFNDFAT